MTLTLHAVMVTYRRGPQLRDYVDALARQTRPLDHLLVVDNDPAGSARWIVEDHGLISTSVRYLNTGENLGPAGGIAAGLRDVLGVAHDDDWVFTLDDDDPPRTPEMIAELESMAESLLTAGAPVGGVGLCGGRFDLARGRLVSVHDHELVGAVASSWIGGNQLPCYRVRAVRRIGVFDPRYFINFEELDYGLRMLDHGLVLYAHGDLWRRERAHLGRASELTAERRLGDAHWRRYYSLRNLVFLLRDRRRWRAATLVTAAALIKPLANAPRAPRLAFTHLGLNVRALADGWSGRMGRRIAPTAKPPRPRP